MPIMPLGGTFHFCTGSQVMKLLLPLLKYLHLPPNTNFYRLISKHPGRRRAMIARILSNICIEKLPPSSSTDTGTEDPSQPPPTPPSPISFVEQLVAFRRLTILLDNNFDKLQMEEFGNMWESSRIILSGPRPHNTSRTAFYKRKSGKSKGSKRVDAAMMTTGYSFTLHPDLSVSITIPSDFYDDELIDELDTNVWDFYNFIGDGTEDFFNQQSSM
jgi:hypothetical protein